MEYLNMLPKHFGLLNKEIFYLNVFIKTERKTIIAKLDRITLKLRINFRVYQEDLFQNGPIYDLNHKILIILYDRGLV